MFVFSGFKELEGIFMDCILDCFTQVKFHNQASCEFPLSFQSKGKDVIHLIPKYGDDIKKELCSDLITVPTFSIEGKSKADTLTKIYNEAVRLFFRTAFSSDMVIYGHKENIDLDLLKQLKKSLEEKGYKLDTLVCSNSELFDPLSAKFLVDNQVNVEIIAKEFWPPKYGRMILGLDKTQCKNEFVIPVKKEMDSTDSLTWATELGFATLTNNCIAVAYISGPTPM